MSLAKAIDFAQKTTDVQDWQKSTLLNDIQTASSHGRPFEEVFETWGLTPGK